MEIIFNKEITQNFDKASTKEWLETNGLGGWASSTICGANTRNYHGMFVIATKPPVGRIVALSKLEETIITNNSRCELQANQFPGSICDSGLKYFTKFTKGIFPVFQYNIGEIEIEKTVAAIHGKDIVVVTYEVKKASAPFTMELKPLVAGRDYHSLSKANDSINRDTVFGDNVLTINTYQGVPPICIQVKGASFRNHQDWFLNFEYKEEQARGLSFAEDLFCYGNFIVHLKQGSKLGIVISTEEYSQSDAFELLLGEKKRRELLFEQLPLQNNFTKTLALAADQFVVKRGEDLKTIIAGYHWFSDWGRDTMIALPGICLVTKKYEDAKKILRSFSHHIHQGIIPNRFPDYGETPEYNTVDATLWYFIAIKKYLDYTGDKDFIVNELYPHLKDIISWHEKGTHYNIHVDKADGLLYSGEYGVQLTWMDAKIGNWVVTPRMGKAVEINALWYNALMILSDFATLKGIEADKSEYSKKADVVKKAFKETFVIKDKGYLYDFVNMQERNDDIRPNQIFALSLPYEILDKVTSMSVLKNVEEHLLTPYGLRSLSPEHYKYEGHYGGNQWSRDGAYHQGTVWSWLLGPYITAKIRLEGDFGKTVVDRLLNNFQHHLSDAGIGTISEIFDGDAPYYPKGCIAQAWSVAEILRAYVEDVKK
jgi:predicted glycogen debranching enzyme